MFYGIDLGTTYSLIGRGDKLFTGLVCSNIDTETGKEVSRDTTGKTIVSSYKKDMSMGESGDLARRCSSIVLRELADRASKVTGEEVKDVVISVPASFTHSQRQAVRTAGLEAGLNVVGLTNEPTAGAICVCKNTKDYIIVYDLGGGTFDVSVVDARTGIYTVIDTNGLMIAGDDFDNAILSDIYKYAKIPMISKTKIAVQEVKWNIQKAKENLQKVRASQFIDISAFNSDITGTYELTVDKYKELMKKTFIKTLDMTKTIAELNTRLADRPKIVFVGGSTACPYLREWIVKETKLEEVKTDIQPDFIVARGVSIYAEMLEKGEAEEEVEDICPTIKIENKNGDAITVIDGKTILPIEGEMDVQNSDETDVLHIKLYSGDSGFAAECDYIGTLEYKYDRVMDQGEGAVTVTVKIDRNGIISLEGKEPFKNEVQKIELRMR